MMLAAEMGRPGRPQKPLEMRAKTRTVAAYNDEWAAVLRLSKGYKTPFDFFRALIREKYPRERLVVRAPKRSKPDA